MTGPDSAAHADRDSREPQVIDRRDDLAIVRELNGDNGVRLAVIGEIDIDNAAQLSDAVRSALCSGPAQIVIDLAEVTFLGSSGLRALLTAQRVASEHDAALTVVNARGIVLKVLTISGLLIILDGHEPYA